MVLSIQIAGARGGSQRNNSAVAVCFYHICSALDCLTHVEQYTIKIPVCSLGFFYCLTYSCVPIDRRKKRVIKV